MDRLTEMEVFTRVVELGGFTEAAKRLGLSKSAVSKHVASLETRLGARLLNRTTRRVSPTEIGLAYFDKAQTVLTAASEADAMAGAMQDTPRGELKVAAPLSFGLRHIAPAVAGFLARHPAVSARLHLDDKRAELVAEGFDLTIRIGELPDSTLIARKLAETDLVMAASPAYLAARGTPESVEALTGHDLLHYTNNSAGAVWRLRAVNGEERAVRVGGRLSVNNGDALACAARDGLGIVLSPHFIIADLMAEGALVEVLSRHKPAPIGVWAVYPAGRFPQPKLRVFIEHLAESLRGKGPRW